MVAWIYTLSSTRDVGTYRLSLRSSHTQSIDVDGDSDQKLNRKELWIRRHGRFKTGFKAALLFVDLFCYYVSCLSLLCCRVCSLIPAGKRLTSWLSCVLCFLCFQVWYLIVSIPIYFAHMRYLPTSHLSHGM